MEGVFVLMDDFDLTPAPEDPAPAPETPFAPDGSAPVPEAEDAAVLRAEARAAFSRLGMGGFVILLVATGVQLLFSMLPELLPAGSVPWAEEPWVKWVLTFAPLYCVAVPLGLLVMRRAPVFPPEEKSFGAGRFLKLVPICFCLMYAGNIVGVLLTSFLGRLKGSAVENPLDSYAGGDESVLVKLLFMVILAPLLEELIFRKTLIDRMRGYGERTAVVTSALMFGLFHGNFSQFFYAAALGLVFGYVYVKTGRLRYSVSLHMLINALGSLLAPWLLENAGVGRLEMLNAEALSENPALLSEALTPGVLVFLLYALLMLAFSVLGLVLLCVNARRTRFAPAERELPREGRARVVWGNAGMILFLVGCLGMIAVSVVL